MEFDFKSYDNSKQAISYCETDKCDKVIKLKQAIEKIKEITKQAREDLYTCESIGYTDDGLREILKICDEVIK